MKDEFCEYLYSLKPKFVKLTQDIYDNWERTLLERQLNLKSKVNQYIFSKILQLIKEEIPIDFKNQQIDYQIFGLSYDVPYMRILTSKNTYKIIIDSNIYECKVNKTKWVKVIGVVFKEGDFNIICEKTLWQDITF